MLNIVNVMQQFCNVLCFIFLFINIPIIKLYYCSFTLVTSWFQ